MNEYRVEDGLELRLQIVPISADLQYLYDGLNQAAQLGQLVQLSVQGYGMDVQVREVKAVRFPIMHRDEPRAQWMSDKLTLTDEQIALFKQKGRP